MGEVVAAECHLRAWGSDSYLDTKGMFQSNITVAGAASKKSGLRGRGNKTGATDGG